MLVSCSQTPSLWNCEKSIPIVHKHPRTVVLGYNSPNRWRQSFSGFRQEGSLTYIYSSGIRGPERWHDFPRGRATGCSRAQPHSPGSLTPKPAFSPPEPHCFSSAPSPLWASIFLFVS